MRSRHVIIGFLFGLAAPFLGLFAGLQISVALGNVLMIPFIVVSTATGTPFGEMPGWLWALLTLVSGCLWAVVFAVATRFVTKWRRSPG